MKRIMTVLLLALVAVGMQAQAKNISYIKDDGSWYQVYDEQGKKISTVSKQTVGKMVGWGSDFFVTLDGAWVKTYDATGKKIATMSKHTVGEIVGVSGDTFTSKEGGWLKIYDKMGKKINTRSAR